MLLRFHPAARRFVFLAMLAFASQARAHPGHPHPPVEVDEFENEASMSATSHEAASIVWYASLLAAGALAALLLRKQRNDFFPE